MPRQVLVIFDAYIYPRKEFEAEFDVLPPFVFVMAVITICTVFVKPPGSFEEYQQDVAVSTSVDPVGLEFF